jgi:hypothetical protein
MKKRFKKLGLLEGDRSGCPGDEHRIATGERRPNLPRTVLRRTGVHGLLVLMMVLWPMAASAQSLHTPHPGSTERKQICDAMRLFVQAHKAPKPVVFKIDQIKILGKYCYFEGYALYADGSRVPERVLPDVVYHTYLKREKSEWRVIHDLSRTDVPSESEIVELRREFPAEIPRELVPQFWRELLRL